MIIHKHNLSTLYLFAATSSYHRTRRSSQTCDARNDDDVTGLSLIVVADLPARWLDIRVIPGPQSGLFLDYSGGILSFCEN